MSEITKEMWDELNNKYEMVRFSEEIYRTALSLTDHTVTVVDIPGRSLSQIYNEGDWTGIASTMENVPESIIETGIIHPDDCDGYREFYNKIYSGVPLTQFTMRVMEEHRGWVWFTMYAKTIFDENGKPLRAVCFSDDISVEKNLEQKYEQYKNAVSADADFIWEANLTKNQMISQDTTYGSVLNDKQYSIYDEICEKAASNFPDTVLGETFKSIYSRESLINSFLSAKREVSFEYPFDSGDGRGTRWTHATAHLMTNGVGDIVAIICANDITDMKKEQELLKHQAEKDSLTGLYNRITFEKKASEILMNEKEAIHAFLMIDLDDFKRINDSYGHAFGDTVLRTTAEIMTNSFRSSDIIGRAGGDEFMIFMKNIEDSSTVKTRAEGFMNAFKKVCIDKNFPSVVTFSIGGSISTSESEFKDMYLRADSALYKSKELGKNRFHMD